MVYLMCGRHCGGCHLLEAEPEIIPSSIYKEGIVIRPEAYCDLSISSCEGPGSYCSWQHGPVLQLQTQETRPAQLSDCTTFTGSLLTTNALNGAMCHKTGLCRFRIVKRHPHFTENKSTAAKLTKEMMVPERMPGA